MTRRSSSTGSAISLNSRGPAPHPIFLIELVKRGKRARSIGRELATVLSYRKRAASSASRFSGLPGDRAPGDIQRERHKVCSVVATPLGTGRHPARNVPLGIIRLGAFIFFDVKRPANGVRIQSLTRVKNLLFRGRRTPTTGRRQSCYREDARFRIGPTSRTKMLRPCVPITSSPSRG